MLTYAQILSTLQHEGPQEPREGICSNATAVYEAAAPPDADCADFQDWLDAQFREWGEFSGRVRYPVPHGTLDPRDAYERALFMWPQPDDPPADRAYGQARLRLLDFLIERAKKQGV